MSGPILQGYEGRIAARQRVEQGAEPAPEPLLPERLPPDPGAVALAEEQAAAILAGAREAADAILEGARREAEELCSRIAEDARQQHERRLTETILSFRQAMRNDVHAAGPVLTQVVGDALRRILGVMPADFILDHLVRQALAELTPRTEVTLICAPADHATCESFLPGLAGSHAFGISLDVDPLLEPGVCRLTSGSIVLEVALAPQLEVLQQWLAAAEMAEPA